MLAKKLLSAISPVVHLVIGERAFHVVPTEKRKIDILNTMLKKEHIFVDNDTKAELTLQDIHQLFDYSFGKVWRE